MMVTQPVGEGLRSLGCPLEVRIGNDASTFNTAHLAGLVFLLRDIMGDQAAVIASNGRALWECLWGFSWFSELHGAPPGRKSVLPGDAHYK
jgi:hypothetical protein